MSIDLFLAVALSSAIVLIVLALVGIIIFQRWRISDKNAALGRFIRENAELRQKIMRAGLLSLVLIFSCCGDSYDVGKKIDIEVSIGSFMPDNMPFEIGDKMTLYAWTGSASSVSADAAKGVEYTFNNNGWSADGSIPWSNNEDPYYFIGFYPARNVSSFSSDPYTLYTANQKESNLLVARNLNGMNPANNNAVSLQFNHAMALLVVNLQFRDTRAGTRAVSNVTVHAASNCTIDYLTQTYSTGEPTDIELPATETAEGYSSSYQSIMIPQEIHTLTMMIDGVQHIFNHADGIKLTEGKYTTLNLFVGRDNVELGDVKINDWVPGDVIDGNSSMGN